MNENLRELALAAATGKAVANFTREDSEFALRE